MFYRLDLSGKLNRLENIMADKDKKTRSRVRVIYADLRADINEQVPIFLKKGYLDDNSTSCLKLQERFFVSWVSIFDSMYHVSKNPMEVTLQF